MQQVIVQVAGTVPLFMHNGRLANPLDKFSKEIKLITGKTKKTDDDHLQIAKLEFLGGLYYDDKIGPYIPADCIIATIINGGKLLRKGSHVERGVFVMEPKTKLEYEGTRDPERMFNSGYADIRGVDSRGGRGGSTVMRCRPIFNPPWSCTFTLAYDESVLSPADLRQCVEYAGKFVGFCDYRPRYGKFTIEAWEES